MLPREKISNSRMYLAASRHHHWLVEVGMQSFLCSVLAFPEVTLCDTSTLPNLISVAVLSYRISVRRLLLRDSSYHQALQMLLLLKGLGFVFCFSILVFWIKLNLKPFSSSQNCQKNYLKAFMRWDLSKRSFFFFKAKTIFWLNWKSKVLMAMPCILNSWGGIFRPAVNTASLSALQWVFKVFWRLFVHWLQKLADVIWCMVCPTPGPVGQQLSKKLKAMGLWIGKTFWGDTSSKWKGESWVFDPVGKKAM